MIDEILSELANTTYQHGQATRTPQPFHYGTPVADAKSKLLEALESCKPEVKDKDPSGYVNEANLRAWQDGYNKCTKQYHSNIRKLFEVEE